MTSSKCDPVSMPSLDPHDIICNILAAYRLIMEVNLLTLKTRSNGYWPPFCFVENSDLICSSMTSFLLWDMLYFLRLTSVCHSSHFSVIGNTESSHVHLENHFDINFSQITDVFPLTDYIKIIQLLLSISITRKGSIVISHGQVLRWYFIGLKWFSQCQNVFLETKPFFSYQTKLEWLDRYVNFSSLSSKWR